LRVWITRSQPGARRQAGANQQAGFEVVIAPVTGVEKTGSAPPPGMFDRVFFLSEHAVRHCVDMTFCEGAEVYAVGPGTARVLDSRGLSATVPSVGGPGPGSDGLIALLDPVRVAGERVLIVAGEDGRKDLGNTLARRGAVVCENLCYRRVALAVEIAEIPAIDAILVSSQDGFRAVARLWFEAKGSPGVSVLAASKRIAVLGSSLGFDCVLTCAGASSEDFIAGLRDLQGR
jgi:uroporphyrinogen-III synthase